MLSYGYTFNIQRHKGLTCHLKFLTFGHSGTRVLSARMSEIKNGRLYLYDKVYLKDCAL